MTDLSNLPDVFTEKELTYFYKLYNNPDGRIWAGTAEKLTTKQVRQVLNFVKIQRKMEYEGKLLAMTAEERQAHEDALHRAGAIFASREFGYLTIYDEYDLVNRIGKFANFQLKKAFNLDDEWARSTYHRLKLWKERMNENESFVLFTSDSPFSVSYPSNFTVKNHQFSSFLQYMVYSKAEEFRDRKIIENCFKASVSKLCEMNYQVRYFNKLVWSQSVGLVIMKGLEEKFKQNEDLAAILKETQGSTLVFADESNNTWGVGLSKDDSRILKRSSWKGKNLLGEALTQVREILFEPGCNPMGGK